MDRYQLFAKYNQWMNNSLYQCCLELGQEAVEKDQGSFFSSIYTTLNHLLIADLFWLMRCCEDKNAFELKDETGEKIRITALDQILYPKIEQLYEQRQQLDVAILDYVASLTEADMTRLVGYRTSKGVQMENPLEPILMHWFNHQTHHRGQVTAMLSQQGVDFGLTDLIYIKDFVN